MPEKLGPEKPEMFDPVLLIPPGESGGSGGSCESVEDTSLLSYAPNAQPLTLAARPGDGRDGRRFSVAPARGSRTSSDSVGLGEGWWLVGDGLGLADAEADSGPWPRVEVSLAGDMRAGRAANASLRRDVVGTCCGGTASWLGGGAAGTIVRGNGLDDGKEKRRWL